MNGEILCQGNKNLRNNLFYFDIRQLIDEGISYESQIKPKLYPEAIIKIVKVIKTLRICKLMQWLQALWKEKKKKKRIMSTLDIPSRYEESDTPKAEWSWQTEILKFDGTWD